MELSVWGWIIVPTLLAAVGIMANHFHHDHQTAVKLEGVSGALEEVKDLRRRVERLEDIRLGYTRPERETE